ncbi:hypothetical protein B0H10DRAFT_2192176 [Mycena sp. CBHHK59/15]|nr:hypothetical protein B0H10DRAFT_2192176 [Mycena sp. CBHHK59/15]
MEKKRKHNTESMGASTSQMGRGIRKLTQLFGEISAIITDGEAFELEHDADDEFDVDESTELTEQELKYLAAKRDSERTYEAYFQIKHLVPNLNYKLENTRSEDLVDFYATAGVSSVVLQKGANDVRAEDLRRISENMGNWLNEDKKKLAPLFDQHTPDHFILGSRRNRRLEHDVSGGLLCPIDIDWDDPKVRADLRSGALDFGVSFYARFLYASFKGNPDNVEDGFLKSKYLVKAYKSVFTAPSSAEGHSDGGKSVIYQAGIPDEL